MKFKKKKILASISSICLFAARIYQFVLLMHLGKNRALLQTFCLGLANDPSEVQSISTDAVYAEQTMRSFNMLSEVMPNKLRTEPWESLRT